MRDDFEGPVWAEHHRLLSDQIGRAIDKLGYVFQRLVAFEYDAPWERQRKIPQRDAG